LRPRLTVLGGLAAFELIRARTSEDRKLTAHQQREVLQRHDAGEPTRENARNYNVSHSTISRLTA